MIHSASADHFLFLGQMHKRSCKLPHCTIPDMWGLLGESSAPGSILSVNVSGAECYDVSSMGTGKGLNGPTSRSLAIWLQQRERSKEVGFLNSLIEGFVVVCAGSIFSIVTIVWCRSPVTNTGRLVTVVTGHYECGAQCMSTGDCHCSLFLMHH